MTIDWEKAIAEIAEMENRKKSAEEQNDALIAENERLLGALNAAAMSLRNQAASIARVAEMLETTLEKEQREAPKEVKKTKKAEEPKKPRAKKNTKGEIRCKKCIYRAATQAGHKCNYAAVTGKTRKAEPVENCRFFEEGARIKREKEEKEEKEEN